MQISNSNQVNNSPNFGSVHVVFEKGAGKPFVNDLAKTVDKFNKQAVVNDHFSRTADELIQVSNIDAKGAKLDVNVLRDYKTATEEKLSVLLENLGFRARTNLSPRKNLDSKSQKIALNSDLAI